jgi:hypothetical protein
MWEGNQKYQDASFRTTMWIAGAGTVLLSIVCFLSGEINPIKNWILGILLFAGAWFIIAGIVYLFVRLISFRRSKAKTQK